MLTFSAVGVCLAWRLLASPLRVPLGFVLWPLKLLAGALSPWLTVIGMVCAALGVILRSPLAVVLGATGAWGLARQRVALTTLPDPIAAAFGPGQCEPAALRPTGRRHERPRPHRTPDVQFWTVPGSDRRLLCDLWQPAAGIRRTGLAVLYFHGSAWVLFDKDVATRPLFKALTAQGHVVMDVAYRLAPETDLAGMVGDVKRAVAWMKVHGHDFGVDPRRVVLAGGSAGGQLALLAAFAPEEPELTPADVAEQDLAVAGVVSFYGPSDLAACYAHTRQDQRPTDAGWRRTVTYSLILPITGLIDTVTGRLCTRLGLHRLLEAGFFPLVVGGRPDEVPARYQRFSPLTYAGAGCPPTLLIQGDADLITPVATTHLLAERLRQASVPVANLVVPTAEHGFDLLLPHISPPARIAQRALDRFLAVLSARADVAQTSPAPRKG
jgi:acetyl esterase/lipase